MKLFNPFEVIHTKYVFFTGKGGVGKTSAACATAVSLADSGKSVMLISTDPASNLQDVFNRELDNKGTNIPEVPNLTVANLDPITAAAEYRESVIAPYRGKLPDSVIANMEEQLSGSCTVEIAAFNEFSGFITNAEIQQKYDPQPDSSCQWRTDFPQRQRFGQSFCQTAEGSRSDARYAQSACCLLHSAPSLQRCRH